MTADFSWGYLALAALPWIILPSVVIWRLRNPTSLAEFVAAVPRDAALISVIVPARNEARNIEPCVRSILAGIWPNIEVIVVDDHSADGTGDIARRIARDDSRVKVISNPDLRDGWIGKQWACHNGQLAARGTFLLFTDADTRHGPELLTRSMNAMRDVRADLFTVVGSQIMGSFWERLIQPHIFGMLAARFGEMKRVNSSANPYDKIANGQFILVTRDVYDRAGGHEAVRTHIAEDMRLAQEWTRLGYSVYVTGAFDYLETRMYEGFGELWRGWGKNLWAAGRDTLEMAPAVLAVVRVASPFVTLWEIAPAAAILLGLAGLVPAMVLAWGAITYTINTFFWVLFHIGLRSPAWYAALNPLAAIVLMGMFARAAWRNDRVEWKGREYLSR
ncbi:MAG TPA: glycosyltransferase family 2 protein [Gemmatimonadaceae bacterium]|nr:glycosyltransferase family 2 protein [Gemmatimonadaceae bacterium]